ncbi:MAG: YfhO family protein [Ignavibacteriae bacterium]|nr:YfhO family protein [Ignavibacteriota bacterium]MCB9217485.1 YfhO family protein [Ignavibacteria bacterium]
MKFFHHLRTFFADRPTLTIILFGLLLSLPLLLWGFPLQSHDGLVHPNWMRYFSEQFWRGELYPRWLTGINGYLGSPAFFNYAPFPYYVGSFIAPLIPGDPYKLYTLGITCALLLTGSGLACFLWLKQVAPSRGAALIGSLFYMVAPYHVAIDLYTRGAVAEFAAFLWLPLVLYGVHLSSASDTKRWYGLLCVAFAFCGLLLTHIPTSLYFSIIPLLYALTLRERSLLHPFPLTTVGMVLGGGLGMFYWLPAIKHQEFIHSELQQIASLRYNNNWIDFTSTFAGGYVADLFWIAVSLTLIAAVSFGILLRSEVRRRVVAFWGLLALFALVMATPLSNLIWQILSPLQRIQFPYRFLLLLTLATVALFALVLPRICQISRPAYWVLLFLTFGGGTFFTLSSLYTTFSPDSAYYQARYARHEWRIKFGLGALEYIPRWVGRVNREEDKVLVPLVREIGGKPYQSTIVTGDGDVVIREENSRRLLVQTNSSTQLTVVVHQFYYHGWESVDDPDVRMQPTENIGLMRLLVPSGKRTFTLEMKPTTEEQVGNIVSGTLLVLLSGFFLFQIFRSRRSTPYVRGSVERSEMREPDYSQANEPDSDYGN